MADQEFKKKMPNYVPASIMWGFAAFFVMFNEMSLGFGQQILISSVLALGICDEQF